MNLKSVLMATTIAAGAALAVAPTTAEAAICPATSFTGTNSNHCNLTITFGANGTITTSSQTGATTNYDGTEDALIGVINNTGHTLSAFNIAGSGIFSLMDNDGINTLTGGTNAAGTALFSANVVPLGGQGYGGADAYYTNVVFGSPDTGTVNFLTPIAANGGTDFFSLEEPITDTHPVITPAPEPTGLGMLGAGLVGMALLRRRRRR